MDIESVRKFFERDRFVASSGISVESVNEREAVVFAPVEDRHLNAGDTVQGGFIFTMADFAFAVLANAKGRFTVSQNATVHFLKARRPAWLKARAYALNEGRNTALYAVDVFDDAGVKIAYVTVTGYLLGENGLK